MAFREQAGEEGQEVSRAEGPHAVDISVRLTHVLACHPPWRQSIWGRNRPHGRAPRSILHGGLVS